MLENELELFAFLESVASNWLAALARPVALPRLQQGT